MGEAPQKRKSRYTPAVKVMEGARCFESRWIQSERLLTAATPPAGYTSPPALAYPNTHKLEPLAHVLSSFSRLLLMHHVSHLPSLEATAPLLKSFRGVQSPPEWAQLYGPKILAVPDKLSTGEYAMLRQTMTFMTYRESTKKAGGAEVEVAESAEDRREREISERWSTLMIVSKTLGRN